jgi:hypothetical protein
MTSRMDNFHIFECLTAPASVRYAGQWLGWARTASGKMRPDFEPIVFRGATPQQVRAHAEAWWAEELRKHAEIEKRRADREASARVRREAKLRTEEMGI